MSSCRKDTLLPTKASNSITIAEARNYFEGHFKELGNASGDKTTTIQNSASHKETYQRIMSGKKALWDKAYQKMISVGGAVRIPLDFGKVRVMVDKKTGASMDLSSLNYLLMYKDSLHQIHAEWVYLQPKLDWLNGNRDTYNGRATVRDWDGNVLKDFSYGTAVNTSQGNHVNSTNGTTTNSGTEYTVWNCVRVANGWCQATGWCASAGRSCDFCLEYCAYEICIEDTFNPPPPAGGNGSSNNGNGYGPSNHGASGGGTSPGDYNPDNCTNGPEVINPDGSMSPPPCIPPPFYPPPPTQNPPSGPLTNTQFVIQALGITELDKINFISNPTSGLNDAFAQYLLREKNAYSIDFGKWLFDYLYANPSVDYHSFLDPNEFDSIESSNLTPTTADPVVDMTGITDVPLNAILGPPRSIASTPNRNNTEDLQYGTNGNTSGILPLQLGKNDNLLFSDMTDLFELLSVGDLQTVAGQFITRFRNGTGGTFENQTLNENVKESATYKNFISRFRRDLQAKINNAGGVLDNKEMDLDYRPIFNGISNKLNGLQILINDTEQTQIKLLNFQIDAATQMWIADVDVVITDHFGLDKNDAMVYQGSHRGFAAWWVLQHTRGYKPFITQIVVRTRLYGGL